MPCYLNINQSFMNHQSAYKIIVPVRFKKSDRWAIAKSITMANQMQAIIHVVYVVRTKTIFRYHPYQYKEEFALAKKNLIAIKQHYEPQLCKGASIEISILHGNYLHELSAYIKLYKMDIMLIGLSSQYIWSIFRPLLSIHRICRHVHIPLLAIKSNGLAHHFKKIVLPLYMHLSMRQLRLAALLARSFKSTVYLISVRQTGINASVTTKLCQESLEILQSLTTVPVQVLLLEGKYIAKATMHFAKKINADLIMIHAAKEFCMPGWWNKLTNKLIAYVSSIPVLSLSKDSTE